MRKGQLLLIFVLLIAFYFIQHRATPSLPMPTVYQQIGTDLKIPISATMQKGGQEFWTLARKSDKTYEVNAYNDYKLIHQFPLDKLISSDATGRKYATTGNVRIDTILYRADVVHMNTDGRSGYIILTLVNTSNPATSNQNTNNGLANTTTP